MTDLDRLAMDCVEGRSVSVSALPIVTAAPDLAAEESVGTDLSLGDKVGSAGAPALVASTAKPATAAKEAAGTYSDDLRIPDFLWRGPPRAPATEQGRG